MDDDDDDDDDDDVVVVVAVLILLLCEIAFLVEERKFRLTQLSPIVLTWHVECKVCKPLTLPGPTSCCSFKVSKVRHFVPGFALWAGAMYMLCFAFITQSWQVYVLNAVPGLETGGTCRYKMI